jgi:hypothetical protein
MAFKEMQEKLIDQKIHETVANKISQRKTFFKMYMIKATCLDLFFVLQFSLKKVILTSTNGKGMPASVQTDLRGHVNNTFLSFSSAWYLSFGM